MFTVDTRKDYCHIRIVYGPQTFTEDGVAVLNPPLHSSCLRDRPDPPNSGWNCRWPLAIIRDTEHSDYSGGSVEASNYNAMQELSVKEPGQWPLVQIYGSHGYRALAYDATLGPVPPTWELCNALDGFENHYPLFDDDNHGALEGELEQEAWDVDGRSDFREALVDVLDVLDENHEHEIPDDDQPAPSGILDDASGNWDSFLRGLWATGCDDLNVNGGSGFVVETGCTVHFYVDEWKAKAGCDKRYPTNKPIHDTLRELAKATRVVDPDAYCVDHGTPRSTCDEGH